MNLDLDLELLRFLMAVVDGGSVAEAARRLRASRATVRRKLEELETHAGTPLVFRRGDVIEPTSAGEVLLRRARQVVAELEALLERANSIGQEPVGVVRIATFIGQPPEGVGIFLRAVRRRHPGLRFDIRPTEDPTESLLVWADIAVTLDRELPSGPWEVLDLGGMREWLVASPDYLARHGRPRRPEDLHGHDLLVWEGPETPPTELPLTCGATLPIEPLLVSRNIHLLREMAAAGFGISYLPDAELRLSREAPDALVPVLPELVGSRRPMRLLVPEALEATPRTHAVAEAIRMLVAAREGV